MNLERAGAAFADAKKAYRKSKSDANRATFHAARDALLAARRHARGDRPTGVVVEEG